jgi:hypothetical protein
MLSLPPQVRPLDVCAFLKIGPRKLKKMIAEGTLPPLTRLSYHVSYWPREQILPLLQALSN